MADNDKDISEVAIKKKFVNLSGVTPIFSNDMTISHTEREFFLSFYQTEPPHVITIEDVEGLTSVNANLIAKIIVTPEFAEAIMKAMQTNIAGYKEAKQKDKE